MPTARRVRPGLPVGSLLAGAALLAGCSSSGVITDPAATSTRSTPSPSSSIPAEAEPAVQAYLSLYAAVSVAQATPTAFTAQHTPEADFTAYSFDPFAGQETLYINSLVTARAAFRGTPPQPRVRVTSIDLQATPYPKILLTNCPTPAPDWLLRDTAGRALDPPSKVPGPHLLTGEMIYFKGRWGLQRNTAEESRTCSF